MGPILSSLVNLQSIETQLRKTEQRLKQSQQALSRQEQQIQRLHGALAAKREEIKLTRMQHDRLELELRTMEDHISKHRVGLNQARTNKDYSAILTRINTEKVDKSKLEDQILALIGQIDADQAGCREIEEQIKKDEAHLGEVQQQAKEKQAVIQAELDRLTRARKEAITTVPPKERAMFERMADRFEGEVLATVARLNGKRGDHSCGGCFMSIPLEMVNSLMSRDEVVVCPSCGRILVLEMNPIQQPTA
jgi:uncharacterized protein